VANYEIAAELVVEESTVKTQYRVRTAAPDCSADRACR
jgi:hypothetical protein